MSTSKIDLDRKVKRSNYSLAEVTRNQLQEAKVHGYNMSKVIEIAVNQWYQKNIKNKK